MTESHIVQDQSAVIDFLLDPASHAGGDVEPERIDTHGAVVVLAGDRAFKLKRAVDYPYMDLSTLARRERACHAEIALNRRTAPETYLEARPIVERRGGLAWGDPASEADREAAADWVVVMRRFDQDRLLDRLADGGALTPEICEALAVEVAGLHAVAEPHVEATPKAMQWVVEENLEEFAENPDLFAPDVVARLGERAESALAHGWSLMERRCREGRVRRCHGDLHLRNVVMIDHRPTIFDAIEFNDRLATVDVLYDLAFLLMDLDHRDLRGHGNRVLNRYLEETGDLEGLALLPLFLSTRAAVRAKVSASIAATVSDPDDRKTHRSEAHAYLAMALDYFEPEPPRLVAIGGLSGTGKTTVARGVAPSLGASPGAVVLRSDVIRKQLHGTPRAEPLPESAYGPGTSEKVYRDIARRAAAVLSAGHAAVADAVYARPEEREAIAAVAAEAGVPFDGIWLEAPVPVLAERVGRRTGDASDADRAVVEKQAGYALGRLDWHRVDASGGPDDSTDGAWVVLSGEAAADPA